MEFKDSLKKILDEKGITSYRIKKDTGIERQSIDSYLSGTKPTIQNILTLSDYLGVSVDRLLRGKEYEGEVRIIHNPPYREALSDEIIKLYNIESAANLMTIFEDKTQNVLGELRIPNLPKCDAAVYVRGDSMYPILKSGDIVAFKRIYDFENIVFGEMYLIGYSINGDEFLVVKYVNKSEKDGYIKLVSYNTNHSPMDIPVENIRAMALIKASVRFNTMI